MSGRPLADSSEFQTVSPGPLEYYQYRRFVSPHNKKFSLKYLLYRTGFSYL